MVGSSWQLSSPSRRIWRPFSLSLPHSGHLLGLLSSVLAWKGLPLGTHKLGPEVTAEGQEQHAGFARGHLSMFSSRTGRSALTLPRLLVPPHLPGLSTVGHAPCSCRHEAERACPCTSFLGDWNSEISAFLSSLWKGSRAELLWVTCFVPGVADRMLSRSSFPACTKGPLSWAGGLHSCLT